MNWKKNNRTEHKLNNGNGKDKQNVLAVFLCVCSSTISKNAIQVVLSVLKAFCVKSE